MISLKWRALFFVLLTIQLSCKEKDPESNENIGTLPTVQSLTNALEKYPDSLQLRIKLVQLYSDSSNYNKALKIVNDGLARDTLNPDLWDIKASVLYQSEDTLGAIKAFEKALSIIPLPDYMISLGSLYAQTKNSKALKIADDLLGNTSAKTQKEALFIKGLYFSYAGDKLKSIDFFNKCIDMDYTYMFAYREKGVSLYDMGKYNDAIAVLNKAVTIQNSFDEGYYWLGRCYEKLNLPQDAIDNYKTALLYDKDFVEAKEALNKLTH